MPDQFIPTQREIDRYRHFRALGKELNHRILKTVPRRAMEDVSDALGMRRGNVLVLDNQDMISLISDGCLFDWYENGKNIVQRYAETHPPEPGSDEEYLLHQYLAAKFRLLFIESVLPGAGLYCRDELNGGDLFLMDIAFSQSIRNAEYAIATRTKPFGGYWTTTGAALPIPPVDEAVKGVRLLQQQAAKEPDNPGKLPISILRFCLDAGAAEHIAYEPASGIVQGPKPRKRRRWFRPRLRR